MAQGDYEKDELTAEELALLGKGETAEASETSDATSSETKEGPETQETSEQTEETADKTADISEDKKEPETEPKVEPSPEEKTAAEAMGLRIEDGHIVDDDGTKIPAKRWKSLYRDYKDAKRDSETTQKKLDLLKQRDPDRYYELYPEERPAGYQPKPKSEPVPEIPPDRVGELLFNREGHPYHGMSLNEIYGINPAFARQLQDQYEAAVRAQREAAIAKQNDEILQRETANEVNRFSESIAEELYGKDVSELSKDEEAAVIQIVNDVSLWMTKNKAGKMSVNRAYLRMKKEQEQAKAEAAKKTVETMKKEPVKSAGTKAVDGKLTGDEAYLSMSAEQFADEIDKMPEAKFNKLMREGSDALRKKYPKAPWKGRDLF